MVAGCFVVVIITIEIVLPFPDKTAAEQDETPRMPALEAQRTAVTLDRPAGSAVGGQLVEI